MPVPHTSPLVSLSQLESLSDQIDPSPSMYEHPTRHGYFFKPQE